MNASYLWWILRTSLLCWPKRLWWLREHLSLQAFWWTLSHNTLKDLFQHMFVSSIGFFCTTSVHGLSILPGKYLRYLMEEKFCLSILEKWNRISLYFLYFQECWMTVKPRPTTTFASKPRKEASTAPWSTGEEWDMNSPPQNGTATDPKKISASQWNTSLPNSNPLKSALSP